MAPEPAPIPPAPEIVVEKPAPPPQVAETPPPSEVDLAAGEKVYIKACIASQAMGVCGSPKLGDRPTWKPLLAKGIETLVENSLNGFRGKRACMPPRGGHEDLTDEQVRSAVHYMVTKSR